MTTLSTSPFHKAIWEAFEEKAKTLEIYAFVKKNIDRARHAGLVAKDSNCLTEMAMACFEEEQLALVLSLHEAPGNDLNNTLLKDIGPVVAQKNARQLSLLFSNLQCIEGVKCKQAAELSNTVNAMFYLDMDKFKMMYENDTLLPLLSKTVADFSLLASMIYLRGIKEKTADKTKSDTRILIPGHRCDMAFVPIEIDNKLVMALTINLFTCKAEPRMADVFDEDSTMPLALLLDKALLANVLPADFQQIDDDSPLNDFFYESIWDCISSSEIVAELSSLVARPCEGKSDSFSSVQRANYSDQKTCRLGEIFTFNFPEFRSSMEIRRNWFLPVLIAVIGLLRFGQITGHRWVPFKLLDKRSTVKSGYLPFIGFAMIENPVPANTSSSPLMECD